MSRPPIPRIRPSRGPGGFTFVELLVVVVIATSVLLFMYQVFFAGVMQTVKGTERLVTIKDAADLFAAIRRDLLACTGVVTLDSGDTVLYLPLKAASPAFPPISNVLFGKKLEFSMGKTATATYVALPTQFCVLRVLTGSTVPEIKKYALPRLQLFRALVILQEHLVGNTPADSRHLFVEIELKPADDTKSKDPVRLSSVFSPPNLGLSVWNFHFPEKI